MDDRVGLGRVAVLDRGEGARRVLRSVRELVRAGLAGAAVAVHPRRDRQARYVREADDAVEVEGSPELVLGLARAHAAWLGPASPEHRAAFADACRDIGVLHLGPSAGALRSASGPEARARLAAAAQVPAAPPTPDPRARVVEVVVARDRRGEAAALGVGDASIRVGGRAVLVEAPSPALSPQAEEEATAAALRIAAAARWVGVCTVRFVVAPGGAPALAGVDHLPESALAVEAATGVDLVRLAIHLAGGHELAAPAAPRRGHAFAAHIAAGEPGGRPPEAPGRVELLRLPTGPDLRAEAAVEVGDEPAGDEGVLATLIARGDDRGAALGRLEQALADADVLLRRSPTSKAWLLALCGRPEVRSGEAGVGFAQEAVASAAPTARDEPALLATALDAYEAEQDLERARFLSEARRGRPRVGPSSGRSVTLRLGGKRHRLEVRQTGPEAYRVAFFGGAPIDVRVQRLGRHERRIAWAGERARVLSVADGGHHLVEVDGAPHRVEVEPAGIVASPMPAVVVSIPVVPGQEVAKGDPVARVESMKVEMAVVAPEAGVVREILTVPNAQVDAGAPLLRIEPLGEAPPDAAAPPPHPDEAALPRSPHDRYLEALDELRRLILGFDLSDAEARRLGARWREAAAGVPPEDAEVLRVEEEVLGAFADVQSLFERTRPPEAGADARPPHEELWHYLHAPEHRGAGLGAWFVARLERALAHYGLGLDEPGRALELALLRMQKAYLRASAPVAPLTGILERRLEGGAAPPGLDAPGARELLGQLAEVTQERFPAAADLAREVRYRRFDRPDLERIRTAAYAQAESDLARLASAEGVEREATAWRLVECTQPLATLLASRMADAPPALRARLVETLMRRYYRGRDLGSANALERDGIACAWADYRRGERRLRVLACFAPAADAASGARALARLAAEVPPERELVFELYLWRAGAPEPEDAVAEALLGALRAAGFPRPATRLAAAVFFPERGFGRQASQQHFTFRGGPADWVEDRRHRGVHPMLFERMQIGRLARFDLERLPSVEDVFLYRGVAQANPKDERLIAVAEVRDLTPVRDGRGRVVQLPHLERMLHEALAGMRRFQARRPPQQRIEWNRVLLTVGPPLLLGPEELRALAERLAPATAGLGLEMVLIDARIPDPQTGALQDTLLRIMVSERTGLTLRYDVPTDRPLEPLGEYQQRVVALRRRGLTHPFEIVRMLAPPREARTEIPPGEFVEHDLDPSGALAPVERGPGRNSANVVVGVVRTFTDRHPEGMGRVVLLGDPSRSMGSLAEPECRRIEAALELAERLGVPLEWFAVSAGAKISMESGTENMDWISRVLRRIVEFTQRGGEINVVVTGINVGAQPYWNAEATMLMHTRGILVMMPGSAMVLTGKEALEYSGSVSAEDNQGIGGYDRIMGPNGQAQYRAGSLLEAIQILLQHYDHAYVAPGERFPRRAATTDPRDRDVRSFPHGPEGGAGFETVGDVFSADRNPERKKPFAIRRILSAVIDQDHAPLERWRDLRGGETAVVWDAHLGGWPVCLLGIESQPLQRQEFVPADGPDQWSAGTLFPQSSKKIARALNSASGRRPAVVLANLSGFDGSPESMRRLQLEYGAEIGRAVVNFDGPIVFCVVSRYHGGAFVVFSKTLRDDIEVVAVEGARASVIGGAPAAAVVFAREVETRARKDPRALEAEKAAGKVLTAVRSEKVGEVAEEFDRVHTVERALQVGSLDRIIAPRDLRPYLVDAVERGMARTARR